jgi:hypothetical protein
MNKKELNKARDQQEAICYEAICYSVKKIRTPYFSLM